jgi:hypothetical protein
MDVLNSLNKCANGLAGGLTGCLLPTGLERFSDGGITAGTVILILVIIALYIMLLVSVYRITGGSWIHTILCLIFGALYLMIVVIYYGMSGYKFTKVQ